MSNTRTSSRYQSAPPHPQQSLHSTGEQEFYSQADTLLILAVFSLQGWRFCRAYSELFCRHSGSGTTGWLIVFWKASCCSCIRIRLACCRSASRSSAVCRLQRECKVCEGEQAAAGEQDGWIDLQVSCLSGVNIDNN